MLQFSKILVLLLLPTFAIGATFTEGKDYQTMPVAENALSTEKVVPVTEFFSYGCHWCYQLDAPLSKWVTKNKQRIYFSKVPVVFNKDWSYYAKASYIIQALTLGESIHQALFKAIVLDKKVMNSDQAMIAFFKEHGVESGLVESALSNSASIDIQLENDANLMAKFQINSVPTLVVNNRYKTNLQMAKTEERLFAILDYLVEKSASASKSQRPN